MKNILWIIFSVLAVILGVLVYVYVSCPNIQIENSCVYFFMRDDISFFQNDPKDIIKELTNTDSVTILCTSGLTNRIVTMLCFYYICRMYDVTLNVIWIKDAACNGYFHDYFESIDNLIIHTEKTSQKILFTGQCQFKYIMKFFNITYNHSIVLDMFNFVRLKTFMTDEIQYFIDKHNLTSRVGIHVRRTDLTGNFAARLINNSSHDDKDFFKYIGNELCFMATDNRETQLLYRKRYKDRIVWYRNISYTTKLRKTSIKNAIIDLYLLSYCKKIKGTKNSRFSEFSMTLKKARNNLV